MCLILDHGQCNEGTTPRSGLIGSNCHLARSCLPLGFRACFFLCMPRILPFRSFCHAWIVAFGLSSASAVAYRAYIFKNWPTAMPRILPFRSFCHVLTVPFDLLRACCLACRASCRFDLSVMRGSLHLVCRAPVQ